MKCLLLAEGGYAPANPPQWIARLRPEVVLLSVAVGDRRSHHQTSRPLRYLTVWTEPRVYDCPGVPEDGFD